MALHHSFLPNLNFIQNPNPKSRFISLRIPIRSVRSSKDDPDLTPPRRWPPLLVPIVASAAILIVGIRARAFAANPPPVLHSPISISSDNPVVESSNLDDEKVEDEEFMTAFESWKSKTYALTVPLRIVALRGSVPPSWIKDFIQVQGKRLKLISELQGTLESIFSDLSSASNKKVVEPKSVMAADLVSIGDSWLSCAISKGLIEPINNVDEQDWFKGLSSKWKVYLCRNKKGELDSNGYIWGAPYRWGTMVIAYKKNKFEKHKLAPIEDWGDLWRHELAGKIAMVDAPQEVVGAVLKYMGASYNVKDIDAQVEGGKQAVMYNLVTLQRQVRLFDSVHYLKAFGVGDVWVAVGWSNDVIPAAKRLTDVAVIVPKSGASIWADLWAVPAATRFTSNEIGGRIRSPSPLIHQWIEFCLQSARKQPFKQQVVPGASPFALEDLPIEGMQESTKGKQRLETNLIDGVPPPEILSRCEFLEPLSEKASEEYQWLISSMRRPSRSWLKRILHQISLIVHTNRLRSQSS